MVEKVSILVVDDEPDNIKLIDFLLRKANYKVEQAADGAVALQKIHEKKYDLILLDILMPEKDGYEVCKELKNNPCTNEIPVIFLTALNNSENIVKGFLNGAVDYITKPFVKEELIARINNHIQLSRSRKEIKSLYDNIAVKNKGIDESINYAKRIQKAVLPAQNSLKEVLPKYLLFFKPKDIVSGDLYWIKQVDEKVIVCVGDGTGHGVPGAFMSLMGISSLNAIVADIEEPDACILLQEMRNHIKKTLHSSSSKVSDNIDMAFCVFDYETKELSYAGAKIPLIVITKNSTEIDKNYSVKHKTYQRNGYNAHYISGSKNISKNPQLEESYCSFKFSLSSGDRFYLFSDGYVDQFGGESGRKYSRNQFVELMLNAINTPIEKQDELLDKEIHTWMNGNKQVDDMTVLGFEIEDIYGEVDLF